MKKKVVFFILGTIALCWTVAQATIGTESEIAKALGIAVSDIHRMEAAVGKHQSLRDEDGQPRAATLSEMVKEMVSRINEIVMKLEESERQAKVEAKFQPIQKIEAK